MTSSPASGWRCRPRTSSGSTVRYYCDIASGSLQCHASHAAKDVLCQPRPALLAHHDQRAVVGGGTLVDRHTCVGRLNRPEYRAILQASSQLSHTRVRLSMQLIAVSCDPLVSNSGAPQPSLERTVESMEHMQGRARRHFGSEP